MGYFGVVWGFVCVCVKVFLCFGLLKRKGRERVQVDWEWFGVELYFLKRNMVNCDNKMILREHTLDPIKPSSVTVCMFLTQHMFDFLIQIH